jgi:hypothetical protein
MIAQAEKSSAAASWYFSCMSPFSGKKVPESQ